MKNKFTWCTTCEAKAFIRGMRGSVVMLDCGHVISAGFELAASRPAQGRRGAPRRRPPDIEVRPVPAQGGKQQDVKPDVKPRPEARSEPKPPAASFDPKRVATLVDDLLKGRKR